MHAHPLATKKRSLMIKAPMLLTSPRNAWESLGLKAAHIGAVALGVVSGSSCRTLKDQDSRDRLVLEPSLWMHLGSPQMFENEGLGVYRI